MTNNLKRKEWFFPFSFHAMSETLLKGTEAEVHIVFMSGPEKKCLTHWLQGLLVMYRYPRVFSEKQSYDFEYNIRIFSTFQ